MSIWFGISSLLVFFLLFDWTLSASDDLSWKDRGFFTTFNLLRLFRLNILLQSLPERNWRIYKYPKKAPPIWAKLPPALLPPTPKRSKTRKARAKYFNFTLPKKSIRIE